MMSVRDDTPVGALVENLFRRESARLTAHYIRRLGPDRAAQAEDIVQETLVRALQSWRFKGVPDNPGAWLWRVSGNVMVDYLRRLRPSEELDPERLSSPPDQMESGDAELALLFLCTDPVLPTSMSIPLTLKLACGFSVQEIAGALSLKPETVGQRLVRAKQRWRTTPPKSDPDKADQQQRIDAVLNIIYLLLNEGYGGHHPDHWQRSELCHEAARLALLLAEHPQTASPAAAALAALCLFQAARLPARLDPAGDIVLLQDQDRSLWSAPLTQRAFFWLERAQSGDVLTPYHLLAGIAACHAGARSYAETDWRGVVAQYDHLCALDPEQPFHGLNRAIALLELDGPDAAARALQPYQNDSRMAQSYLLPATHAHILARQGQTAAARRALIRAIDLAPSDLPRQQLHRRLKDLS